MANDSGRYKWNTKFLSNNVPELELSQDEIEKRHLSIVYVDKSRGRIRDIDRSTE